MSAGDESKLRSYDEATTCDGGCGVCGMTESEHPSPARGHAYAEPETFGERAEASIRETAEYAAKLLEREGGGDDDVVLEPVNRRIEPETLDSSTARRTVGNMVRLLAQYGAGDVTIGPWRRRYAKRESFGAAIGR